jgi:hypothetical protein
MLEAEQSSKLADVGKAASGGAGAADVGANALARADASVATEDMETALPESEAKVEIRDDIRIQPTASGVIVT